MSDETRHPERRAGQRTVTGYGCTYGDQLGGPWCPAHDEGEDGWKLWNDGVSTGMKDGEALCPGHADAPATPQPSAPVVDRSACKTFCGQTYWQLGVCDAQGATSAGNEWRETAAYPEPSSDTFSNIRTWCSPACRDARLPPLAAQPAEENPFIATCCGAVGLEAHRPHCKLTKPAEQPKPAAKAECLFFGKSKLHGGEIHFRHWKNMHGIVMGTTVCDYHYLHEIEPKGGGSDVLHNDKVPERLPRPRLAHSMGIEDPTLPEAR